MHEILVKFKVVKNNTCFEVLLDKRLSFIDNFKMLRNILKININNISVYDPSKGLFLNTSIPIVEFNINRLMILYLF